MKSSVLRRLALLLMLSCAGAQSASGSALVGTSLALGLHAHGHAHAASIVSERGHLHLVLSHAHDTGPHRGDAVPRHLGVPASFSEGDHVFEIVRDDATPRSLRRWDPVPGVAPAIPAAPPLCFARPVLRAAPARDADSNHLRAVVLRL